MRKNAALQQHPRGDIRYVEPPVAGCSPAIASVRPVFILQAMFQAMFVERAPCFERDLCSADMLRQWSPCASVTFKGGVDCARPSLEIGQPHRQRHARYCEISPVGFAQAVVRCRNRCTGGQLLKLTERYCVGYQTPSKVARRSTSVCIGCSLADNGLNRTLRGILGGQSQRVRPSAGPSAAHISASLKRQLNKRCDARWAPSRRLASLPHTTSSATRPQPAEVSKPQSVPARTRAGSPRTAAICSMRSATTCGCSMKLVRLSITPATRS